MAPSPAHHRHTAPSSSQAHTAPSYTQCSSKWSLSEETNQQANTPVAVPQAIHAGSSHVPQQYVHKPKYAWVGDLPQTSSLSATCLNSEKCSLWSSSLPMSYQQSLELLTKSLARWNSSGNTADPRNRRSSSAEPDRKKPPSAGSSKLKRSPSVESVASITTSTASGR